MIVMDKKHKRTHGEECYFRRENIDSSKSMSDICNTIAKLPPKMKRDEAFKYYGKQIRKFFGVDEEIRSHFVKVEDYLITTK